MNPHPRIRKTIKWGGAAVTVLLVVVWIGSAWWEFWWSPGPRFAVFAHAGIAGVGTALLPSEAGVLTAGRVPSSIKMNWWFSWGSGPRGWMLMVPLWAFVMVSLLLNAAVRRLDALARRRARLNLCPKCNYDRAGIVKDAKCPECGANHPPT